MHLKNDIPDFEILAAYFAGEASPENKELVDAWINSGNEVEFYEIEEIWRQSDIAIKEFDTEAALKKVNNRIDTYKPRYNLRIISIAAAVLIALISIPLIILNINRGHNKIELLSFNSGDSISQLKMSDGSMLTLNSNSSIEYQSDFDKKRTVELKGEAYFEVAHIDNDNKFIVDAGGIKITVIGTKFNVKAYESSDLTEVSVTEGIVRVSKKDNKSYTELHANEKAVFNKTTGEIVKDSVMAQNEIFWKTRTIIFDNANPQEIASVLSKIYDIEVEVNIIHPENYKINTEFTGNSLDEVIKILELTLDLKFRHIENRLIIEEND